MKTALLYINVFFLVYFVLVNGFYLFLVGLAGRTIRRYVQVKDVTDYNTVFETTFYKPVTIIVPAHNEQTTIEHTVSSVLAVRYPELEVVVVNDGSTDDTMEVLKRTFHLIPTSRPVRSDIPCQPIRAVYDSLTHPGLRVVDKEPGGKADALNAGINASSYPLVCNIDADSLIDVQSMVQITRPFLEDHRVVAVGGVVIPANDCVIEKGEVKQIRLARRRLARFQIVEYIRAFLFGRLGWSRLDALMIISGAFAIFRRTALIEVGGYRTDTVGEDMELVLRMHRFYCDKKKPYRILFLPDPICWTQVPEDLRSLARQRRRWQQGLAQSLLLNRQLFLNPRYGRVGLVGYPFFMFFELLSPLVELLGYVAVAIAVVSRAIDWPLALSFLASAMLLGSILSASSLLLEHLSFRKYPALRDTLTLFAYGVAENLGYRQLHSFWRSLGLIDFLRGAQGWGKAARRAF